MFRLLRRLSAPITLHSPHAGTQRGTTAVEMALIAPVFFLILMGIVEMSLVMFVQHLMENTTYNAARLSKTGFIESGKTQSETVMDVVIERFGSLEPLVDVSKLTVTPVTFANLSNIGQPEQGTEGLGAPQEIVVYTLTYPWKLFTPMVADLIGDQNGELVLTSRIVVRNEPFDD